MSVVSRFFDRREVNLDLTFKIEVEQILINKSNLVRSIQKHSPKSPEDFLLLLVLTRSCSSKTI
jgi:hypothetical protein